MSRENIRFNGMNRNSNVSDSRVGDCEELINVKSENGALKIVRDNHEISANIPYRDIIIHDVAGMRNFIGKDSSGWVWFEPQSGIVLMRLHDSTEDVHVATLNNMLTISDRRNIITKTYLYSATPNTYTLFSSGLNISIVSSVESAFYDGDHNATENPLAPSKAQYLSSLQGFVNRFEIENKEYCEGIFLYAFTVTLYDGTETGMYGLGSIATAYTEPPEKANAFISISEQGGGQTNNLFTRFYWNRFYQKHTVRVTEDDTILKSYKDIIKSVNLYVSVPITRMPLVDENVELKNVWFNDGKVEALAGEFIFDAVYPKDSKAEKALLYRQKSWTLQEFCQGLEYTLEFGGDIQATGKTMEVSASSMTRAGEMLSYNNRLHFFNSAVRLNVPLGNMYCKWWEEGYPDITADVYVFLKVNGEDQVIKYPDVVMATRSNDVLLFSAVNLPAMVIYPDSRAYRMIITTEDPAVMVEGYSKLQLELQLSSSPAYNYSYAYSSTGGFVPSNFSESDVNMKSTYEEKDAVNVTAQGNPLVFPVEHSYLFAGAVQALAYATEPISQTQIGQYPLYVFTDKGIYAMEQGSGTVLYANQILINTDKCRPPVIQTRNGVVYMTNSGICILSGRNTLNISLPVDGPVDMDIRKAEAYPQCCMGDMYNMEHYLSQVELREYINEANFTYVPYKDELIVSNPDYRYSYVFSFIYKTWHKVSDSFDKVGDNIIRKAVSTSSAVSKAAKGEIIVANAVVTPAHTFSVAQQAIYSGGDFISGINERYALVVDGVQVSSALFRYPTRLPLMLAILCKDIPYLDCWYDGSSHFVLTDMAFGTGAQLELVQTSNSYKVFGVPFSDYQAVVSIPDKAVGSNLVLSSNMGGSAVTRNLKAGDTVLSIATMLDYGINSASGMGFVSDVGSNILTLTAETAGAAGNDIEITFLHDDYVSLYYTELSGGKNISLEPGDYGVLVDCTREKYSTREIHIQSRPMSFGDAYTIVRRMVLHCKASLTADKNLSLYLFASNDLYSWQCVAAAQRAETVLDHIRLQRPGRTYKHYVIIIGGRVYTTTELSYITLEVEEKFSSKIR